MDWGRKEFSAIKQVLSDSHKGMTVTEISKAVGMNRHSVAKYMDILVAAGHVDMRTYGHAKIFHLSHRVPISAMLSFSSDLIVTVDQDLLIVDSNDKFLEFAELGREAAHKKNLLNFSFPLQCQPPLLPYLQAALEGKETSADLSYCRGDAEYFLILKAIPTVFESGDKGATLILSDATERVRAREALLQELEVLVRDRTAELERSNRLLEAEIEKRRASENLLRESEEKYRSLVENVNDMVWEVDAQGRFTYVSPGVKEISGYEPEEVVGRTLPEILASPNRDYIIEDTGRLLREPQSYSMREAYLRHKDGREVIIESNGAVLYDEQGNFKGYRGVNRDITARKRSEEALRAAEEKYRSLVENVNEMVWEVDARGVFTYVSPGVKDCGGYAPSELIGRTMADFLTPAQLETMQKDAQRYLDEGQIQSVPQPYTMKEILLMHKDGHEIIVESSGTPRFDEQGNFIGYRGIGRDITARRRSEEALRVAEEKYRSLVENVNDMVWEVDAQGRFTYVSPGIKGISGYRPEELVGETLDAFLAPSGRDAILGETEQLLSVPQSYAMKVAPIAHKDGHAVFIESNGTAQFDGQGRFTGYRGVARDITARRHAEEALRKAEEKYRSLVENISDAVWEMDPTGAFTYCSPRMYDLLGYRPEELMGLRPFDLMTPRDEEKLFNDMAAMVLYKHPASIFTGNNKLVGEHLHKDGHPVLLEIKGNVILDDQGNLTGYAGVARDISDRGVARNEYPQGEAINNPLSTVFPDLILRIGADGTILEENSAWTNYFVNVPGDLKGKTVEALPAEVGQKLSEALRQIKSLGKQPVIQFRLALDDNTRHLDVHIQPVPGDQIVVIMRPVAKTD